MDVKAAVLAAGFLLALPTVTMAGPSYRYIEVDYLYLEGVGAAAAEGGSIGGSVPLSQFLHAYASYARFREVPGRAAEAVLGLGIRHGITPATDLVARVGMVRIDGGASRSSGNLVVAMQAGLRSMTTPNMEMSALVSHAGIEDAPTWLGLRAHFALDRRFALGVGADIAGGEVRYHVGMRAAL
jgi:hypothetical protein